MSLIIGGILGLIAAAILMMGRAQSGANVTSLGWMSQQWLAEQRASHPQP